MDELVVVRRSFVKELSNLLVVVNSSEKTGAGAKRKTYS